LHGGSPVSSKSRGGIISRSRKTRTKPLNNRPGLAPYLYVVVACAIWGGNWVTARWIVREVSPLTLVFWRCFVAACIAGVFALPRWREEAVKVREDWPMLALIGIIGTALFSTFGYFGVRYTTATNASLMGGAGPFIQVALSWLVLRHTITAGQLLGMTVSLAGVVVIVCGGSLGALARLAFNPGDLLLLCGVLSWQTYTVLLGKREKDRRPRISPSMFLLVTGLAGSVAAIPGYAWEVATGRSAFPLTVPVMTAAAYLFIFPAFVAFFLWVRAVPLIGPNRATFFNPLIPVFGVIGAVLFLGEALHGYHLAGFVLVVAGLVLVSIRPGARRGS
jgi:drug/metabolite transporter (DMT)-like permease